MTQAGLYLYQGTLWEKKTPLIDYVEEWTYALIDKVLYMYPRGVGGPSANTIYTYNYDTDAFGAFIPNFLVSFQGIFKAGTRLGAWDIDNTIYWSSNLDTHDFTPSLTTLAGYAQFEGVTGDICTIKSHKEGFIIYCYEAIIGVRFLPDNDLLWDAYDIYRTN
jgi:hypothetical protein